MPPLTMFRRAWNGVGRANGVKGGGTAADPNPLSFSDSFLKPAMFFATLDRDTYVSTQHLRRGSRCCRCPGCCYTIIEVPAARLPSPTPFSPFRTIIYPHTLHAYDTKRMYMYVSKSAEDDILKTRGSQSRHPADVAPPSRGKPWEGNLRLDLHNDTSPRQHPPLLPLLSPASLLCPLATCRKPSPERLGSDRPTNQNRVLPHPVGSSRISFSLARRTTHVRTNEARHSFPIRYIKLDRVISSSCELL